MVMLACSVASAQQRVHGPDESPEEKEWRIAAIRAVWFSTRMRPAMRDSIKGMER